MRKIAVHQKSVVLVLNKKEAAAIAHQFSAGYFMEGKESMSIRSKLIAALDEIGEIPERYGLLTV